jgi:hypothetical protein
MNHTSSTRRALITMFAMTFACATILGSCGIPEDDRPREIDPSLLEDITDRS